MSSNDALTSFKVATSLMNAGAHDDSPSYSTHTVATVASNASSSAFHIKYALQKLKEGNVHEKSELQRLNQQLHSYLENVRMLEALNKSLGQEVNRAKAQRQAQPAFTEKNELTGSLEQLRAKLEQEQQETVRNVLRIEDGERLAHLFDSRIGFYQGEAEATRARLSALQQYLNQVESEREHLMRGAVTAQEFIKQEQDRQMSAEQEIEKYRLELRDVRAQNKRIEYEIKTMLDMTAFYKHAYSEEVNEYRQRPQGGVLSTTDLQSFYRGELENAIRQIRQDFEALNDQQLKEYKAYKENELNMIAKQVEHDRMIAEQTKVRHLKDKDLENASARELSATLEYNRQEANELNARYAELVQKLDHLEQNYEQLRFSSGDRMQQVHAELEQLRYENDVYAGELDYWERVQRVRLDSEIQAYRSLLNYQTRTLQQSGSSHRQPAALNYEDYYGGRPSGSAAAVNDLLTRPSQAVVDYNNKHGNSTFLVKPTPKPALLDNSSKGNGTAAGLVTTAVAAPAVTTAKPLGSASSVVLNGQQLPSQVTTHTTVNNNITETSASSSIVRGAAKYEDKIYGDRSKSDTINVLRQVFDHFDADKSGMISISELDKVLAKLNVKLSKEQLQKLMRDSDKDASGDLNFDEFCRILLPVFTGKFQDDELLYAFKKFDLNGTGYISVKELKQVLSNIGQNFSDSQIASMIASVDKDKDGQLNFEEFRRLMKSS